MNRRAFHLVEALLEEAQRLGIAWHRVGRASVIDCGIDAPGGLEAGRRFSEICLAGLGQVEIVPWQAGSLWLPGVQVYTDHPLAACLGAQYAGWAIKGPSFFAMGSGPGRAVARVEPLFEQLPLGENCNVAVLCLEGRKLPTAEVVVNVARQCHVEPEQLTLLIAPTASPVGSVQVAARAVETALHKLHELRFDVTRVRTGWGVAPLAPVAAGDLEAIGRTNDALLYGSRVMLTVAGPEADLAEIIERLPAAASPDYGRPFLALFRRYGDFYKIDPMLFSPAEVILTSLETGRSFRAGRLDPELLAASLLEGGAGGEV
jgi:methenyltetrahydromethanopterin cyclohydrolase